MMSHEVSPKGDETIGIDGTSGGRGNLGRPLSPGSVSKVVLQELQVNTGLLPRKTKKNYPRVFAPLGIGYEDQKESVARVEGFNLEEQLRKPWVTADAIRDDTEGSYLILSIRDFIIYLVFLSLIMTIAYGPTETAYSYYEIVFSDLITKSKFETTLGYGISDTTVISTFRDVGSIKQLWDFINKVLVKVIYTKDPLRIRLLQDNIFVGTPSIRQIRVKKDTCITAPMFHDLFKTCYSAYSKENEDKEPIGEGISTPWIYTPASAEAQGWTSGIKAIYPAGGYTMNFSMDASFTINWLKELERNHWIGPGTRAVIIDFALYTPNANLFLIVKLVAEVLPEGGVKTKQTFLTEKFFRYNAPYDFFVMSCELLFVVFTIYFMVEEGQQIFLLRKKYLRNWWNVLDLMIIGISFIQCFAGLKRIPKTIKYKHEIFSKIGSSIHSSYYAIVGADEEFKLSCSFLIFAVWLKIFKFASLFHSVTLLVATIDRVKWELLTLSLILFTIFAGFSIFGFCLFGAHVDQYQDIIHSYLSVVSMFVGRLYYIEELLYAQSTLAKLFIGAYNLIVVCLFLSAYIALVGYAYQQSHLAYEDAGNFDKQYMGDLLYSLYINILSFCRLSMLVNSYRSKDDIIRNNTDYDAFLTMLKRYGWSLKELNLFLNSYGLYRGARMNLDELTEIYNGFWLRNQLFIEVQAHDEIREQLDEIFKTIDFCEHTIVDVMSKTDLLADKADAKVISKRRS